MLCISYFKVIFHMYVYFLVHHKSSLIWKKSKVYFYEVVIIYTFHSISFLFNNACRKRRDKIIPTFSRKYMNVLCTTVVELQLSEESRIVFSSYPKILISCVSWDHLKSITKCTPMLVLVSLPFFSFGRERKIC